MQDDLLRALKMIRGQPNVGSNRLQVPMLPMGPAVQLSFAGMLPASDHAMKNDILFGLREQLLGAGAASVKVNDPISTYRVGSDLTATGFGTELG